MKTYLAAATVLISASTALADCRNDDRYVQIEQCTVDLVAATSDTARSEALLYRCQAYDMLGQYQEAVDDCLRAKEYNPRDASIHNSLSIIYQNMDKIPSAIAASSEAIALSDTSGGYFNVRSNAYCAAGRIEKSVDDRLSAMRKGYFTERRLQEILQSFGYYDGPLDGDFGSGSISALRRWTAAGC